MSMLDAVISKWNAEVEEETIELIKRGVPPHAAKDKAIRIVSERRGFKNDNKGEEGGDAL